jgi:putative ABC transport system permease protein
MRRWGDGLVVAEVAIAVLLAVGAGLLVRSFRELQAVPAGLDPNGVMTMELAIPGTRYDSASKIQRFYDELVDRTQQLPGVTNVALVSRLPLTTTSWSSDFIAEGRAIGEHGIEVVHREISPGYFATMRVPLLAGRDFSETDGPTSPPVIIVNDALVRSYFGDEDPIGQRLAFDRVPDSASVWRTIVGVVGSEHQGSLGEPPRMEIFQPDAQSPSLGKTLVARTTGDPTSLAPSLRSLVAELDPNLAITRFESMPAVAARSLALQRFLMVLFLLFAIVGVTLAVVGVYGVLAQVTKRRTREMGIRLALGAEAAEVRWLVVRQGLRLTLIGLAAGSIAALVATRAMSGLLFGVPATDPVTFGGVGVLVALAGVMASLVPAIHASRADPAIALRGE